MRNKRVPHISILYVGLILILSGCGLVISDEDDDDEASRTHGASFDAMGLPALRSAAETYADCSELQSDVNRILTERQAIDKRQRDYWEEQANSDKKHNKFDQVPETSVGADGFGDGDDFGDEDRDQEIVNSSAEGADDSFTNVQEAGVDEADTTKIGAEHIYNQVGNKITVADRATYKKIGDMTAPANQLAMYASGPHLILLSNENSTKTVCVEEKTDDGIFTQQCQKKPVQGTHVAIYAAAKGELPKLKTEHQIDGNFYDSRLLGDRLILAINNTLTLKKAVVTNGFGEVNPGRPAPMDDINDIEREDQSFGLQAQYTYHIDVEIPAEPVTLDEDGTVAGIACGNIAKPALPDLDFRIAKIAAVPLDGSAPQVIGVMGGGDQIYMSQNSVYVAKSGSNWPGWISPDSAPEERDEFNKALRDRRETSILTQVVVKEALAVTSTGSVPGLIKNQWSFHQYETGQLAVFTHTRQASDTRQLENHLYVLKNEDSALKTVAAIKNFGHNEDLKAARYVGDKAYAITFRQTDPLFAFDMANPEKPALLGELEVPGFSAYLHPLAADRLIGVGFGNGVEVSLFDVSDPTAPTRLDVMSVGANNAEITGNHRAFYIDEKRKRFGFSFSGSNSFDFLNGSRQSTGAFVIDVVDDKLVKTATLSHRITLPGCKGGDISRMYDLDGKFVTVSATGIVGYAHEDLNLPSQKASFDACLKDVADDEEKLIQ